MIAGWESIESIAEVPFKLSVAFDTRETRLMVEGSKGLHSVFGDTFLAESADGDFLGGAGKTGWRLFTSCNYPRDQFSAQMTGETVLMKEGISHAGEVSVNSKAAN